MKKILSILVAIVVVVTSIIAIIADGVTMRYAIPTYNIDKTKKLFNQLNDKDYMHNILNPEMSSKGATLPVLQSQMTIGYMVNFSGFLPKSKPNGQGFFIAPEFVYNAMKESPTGGDYTFTTKQDCLIISSVPYTRENVNIGNSWDVANAQKTYSNKLMYMKAGTKLKFKGLNMYPNIVLDTLNNKSLPVMLSMQPQNFNEYDTDENGTYDSTLFDDLMTKPTMQSFPYYRIGIENIIKIFAGTFKPNNPNVKYYITDPTGDGTNPRTVRNAFIDFAKSFGITQEVVNTLEKDPLEAIGNCFTDSYLAVMDERIANGGDSTGLTPEYNGKYKRDVSSNRYFSENVGDGVIKQWYIDESFYNILCETDPNKKQLNLRKDILGTIIPDKNANLVDLFFLTACVGSDGSRHIYNTNQITVNPVVYDIVTQECFIGNMNDTKQDKVSQDFYDVLIPFEELASVSSEPNKYGWSADSDLGPYGNPSPAPNAVLKKFMFKYGSNSNEEMEVWIPLMRGELSVDKVNIWSVSCGPNDKKIADGELYTDYNEPDDVLETYFLDPKKPIELKDNNGRVLQNIGGPYSTLMDVDLGYGTDTVTGLASNGGKGMITRGQLVVNARSILSLVGGAGNKNKGSGTPQNKPDDDKKKYEKGVEWTFDNTNSELQYAEVKNGKDEFKERFEAMAGVPSKENLHLSVAAPSMLANVSGVTYPVKQDEISGQYVGHSKYLVNIPYKATNSYCTVKINVSGDTNSSIELKSGSASELEAWAQTVKNDVTKWCASNHITGMHTWTEGEPPKTANDGGYDKEPKVDKEKTITLPACCFYDASTPSITLPTHAIAIHSCKGGSDEKEGNWTITVSFEHKQNGFMGKPDDWQDFIKVESSSGDNATKTLKTHNNIVDNAYRFNGRESYLKEKNGDYSESGLFNHIKITPLMLNPKYLIFTEGNLWTSKYKSENAKITVLSKTTPKEGDDSDSFKYPKDFFDNIGNTTQVVARSFENNIDRFSMDLPDKFELGTVSQKFNEGAPNEFKNEGISTSHFLRGLITTENVWHSPGYAVSLSEQSSETNIASISMNSTNWHGGLENQRLSDAFMSDGSSIPEGIKEALQNNIEQFTNTTKKILKAASTQEEDGALFFSTDILESDSQMLDMKLRDVRVLHSGYFLYGEWQDEITDGGDYSKTEEVDGKQVKMFDGSSVPSLTDRISNIRMGDAPVDFVIGMPITGLKSKCEAENWERQDAYYKLNCHGRDRQYYSSIGYNGYFRMKEGMNGQKSKKLMKFSGIGITASGEASFYNSAGMLHCYDADLEISPSNRYPAYSMHKYDGKGNYQECVQIYMDKPRCEDRLITMDPKIEQGVREPVSKVEFSYSPPTCGYLNASGGNAVVKTSKYINGNFNYDDSCDIDRTMEINSIYVRNPSSVQYCRILCNPEYMDMRVEDDKIYKGGESRELDYNNKQQEIDTENIKYTNNNNNRLYYNYNSKDWDEKIEDRRKTVNFINVGSEFQMLYSDKYDIFKDQFDATRPTKDVDLRDYGLGQETSAIVNEKDEPIQSSALFGISKCSKDILGYGWGKESCLNDLNYSSAFPYSNMFNEGRHNYVVARNVIMPFDCTVLSADRQFRTYKADTLVDLNDLYQWLPDNDLGKFNSIENVAIEDCEVDGNIVFKFTGQQHPEQYDDGSANDNVTQTDRVIYGLCLLSNNESVNVRTGFFQEVLPAIHRLSKSDVEQLDVINYKKFKDERDGSKAYGRIDIVGSIGNLTLNDVGDFRFANLFKESLAGTWLIQGSVRGVDTQKSNTTMQTRNNILGDLNSEKPNKESIVNGNTTGTQPHKKNFLRLPITAYQNNNETYQNVQLKLGYKQYFDLETFGNYNGVNTETEHLTNRIAVKPRYYLYKFDTEEGESPIEELDLYYLDETEWKNAASNKFDITDQYNIGITTNQTVEEIEDNRANCTRDEKELTHKLQDKDLVDTAYFNAARDYMTGTSNLQILDQKNRDYTGGVKLRSYDTIYGSDLDNCAQYVPDEYIDVNDEKNIGELNFAIHNQKYYFTIGCPSSILFVPTKDVNDDYTINLGDKSLSQYVDDLESKYRKLNAVVIETLQVQAYGPVWSLELKEQGSSNDEIRIELGTDGVNYRSIDLSRIRNSLKGIPVAIGDLIDTSAADYNVRGMY